MRSHLSPSRESRSPSTATFTLIPRWCWGTWSRKDRLYGGEEGYSVEATGELSEQLREAIKRLPELAPREPSRRVEQEAKPFTPPPLETHITEGSFFVGEDRTIYQMVDGQAEAVNYGGTALEEQRHDDRQAARSSDRDSRCGPACPSVPEPGLARSPPRGGTTRTQSPVRRLRFAVRPDQQDDLQSSRRRAPSSNGCPTSRSSSKTPTPCS